MDNEWKSNIRRGSTWLRGLFMLLFAVIYSVAEIVLLAVVVFQFLYTLFTGVNNRNALDFGRSLSMFIYQVFSYLTYNSEQKPFPFGSWPKADAIKPAFLDEAPAAEQSVQEPDKDADN